MIQQNFGSDKVVYDVFSGGGAITFECLLQGLDVRYNELNPTVGKAIQLLLSRDREFIKGLLLSRAEFFELRKKERFDGEDYLKLLVNSFGNNMSGYLYAERFADVKYQLAKEIIEIEDVFGEYKQTKTYQQTLGQLGRLVQLEQLQQLQQLQRLQQLQQLQQPEMTSLDYKAFSHVEGAVFYLDPPYEGTAGYYFGKNKDRKPSKEKYREVRERLLALPRGTEIIEDDFRFWISPNATQSKNRMYVQDIQYEFDSATFYDWACQMAQKNIVLVSSYEIPDERFEMVYEFEKARSTLNGGIDSRKSKTERLFMVKGIKEWQQ